MIVRLMTEGQYQVPGWLLEELNRIDDHAQAATTEGDAEALHEALEEMWALVRANGELLPDDKLAPSDAIVPPADLSLDEAHDLLHGEGLIPDLPG